MIGATAVPARVITRFWLYVPPRTNAICPAPSVSNAFCTVRHGWLIVPGLESEPEVAT